MIVLIYKYSYLIIKKDVILSVCVDIIFVGLNFCINGIIFVLIFGIFFVVIELIVLWYFR